MIRKIQKTICREEYKSRIPSLFPYMEEDENGVFKIHRATDALDGSYGKIVPSICIPCNLTVNDNIILSENTYYSYRTIINYYYQYKDELDKGNEYIKFVEDGIGIKQTPFETLGLNPTNNDLVPEEIYLSEVKQLSSMYSQMKTLYDHYTNGDDDFDLSNINDSDICCFCTKYRRMGSNKFYEYLLSLYNELDVLSEKYYNLSVKEADLDKTSIIMTLPLVQSMNDNGYLSCYINQWVGGEPHYKGELYTYNEHTYRWTGNDGDTDRYDEDLMRFIFEEKSNKFERITEKSAAYPLNGVTNSKLKSLRRYKSYINGDDEEEIPESGKDWLFYYRKGSVINYALSTDDMGNILSASDPSSIATEKDDLMAYGDAIIDIIADKNNKTITFVYVIGSQLTTETMALTKDDDGNIIYHYGRFKIKENSKCVKYTETYSYSLDSELDDLINGTRKINNKTVMFSDYISNESSSIGDYGKYEFDTDNISGSYSFKNDSQIVSIPYISSNLETQSEYPNDYLYSNVYKENYLDNITFKPTVENNVRINRGNYSAFERHLKLSEIKTMEDLENYSNGSFFNLVEST